MSSAAAVNSPPRSLVGEVGRRRLDDLHADPEVRPRLGDGGRDGREARVRGGRHGEQLRSCTGPCRPSPSTCRPSSSSRPPSSSLVAALASNATGAAALASNAHDPGGTSASARRPSPPSAPSTIACRSMAPRSALRTRASRSSGWLARRLSRTVASVVVGYLTLVTAGSDARAAGDGRGEARDAVDGARAERLGGRGVVLEEVELDALEVRHGELWCPSRRGGALSESTDGRGPQRDVATRARHQGDRREERVGVVELAERIRPGADRRLGERALGEVREGHVRQEMRGKQRLRRRGKEAGDRRGHASARPSSGRRAVAVTSAHAPAIAPDAAGSLSASTVNTTSCGRHRLAVLPGRVVADLERPGLALGVGRPRLGEVGLVGVVGAEADEAAEDQADERALGPRARGDGHDRGRVRRRRPSRYVTGGGSGDLGRRLRRRGASCAGAGSRGRRRGRRGTRTRTATTALSRRFIGMGCDRSRAGRPASAVRRLQPVRGR